jgi:hypothetical protein
MTPFTAIESLKTTLAPEQVITDPVQVFAYEVDANLIDRAMPDAMAPPPR